MAPSSSAQPLALVSCGLLNGGKEVKPLQELQQLLRDTLRDLAWLHPSRQFRDRQRCFRAASSLQVCHHRIHARRVHWWFEMENKNALISVKVEPSVKKEFEDWCFRNHFTPAEAIRLYLKALLEHQKTGDVVDVKPN